MSQNWIHQAPFLLNRYEVNLMNIYKLIHPLIYVNPCILSSLHQNALIHPYYPAKSQFDKPHKNCNLQNVANLMGSKIRNHLWKHQNKFNLMNTADFNLSIWIQLDQVNLKTSKQSNLVRKVKRLKSSDTIFAH